MKDGSIFSETLSSKPKTAFGENIQMLMDVSMQRRAEKCQGQAACPSLGRSACEKHAQSQFFHTDIEALIRAIPKKVRARWHNPQADRPRGGCKDMGSKNKIFLSHKPRLLQV